MPNSINGPGRGINEPSRSEAPLSSLQSPFSALWHDKNLITDTKQKPIDDISAICFVDVGLSHKVCACWGVCVCV